MFGKIIAKIIYINYHVYEVLVFFSLSLSDDKSIIYCGSGSKCYLFNVIHWMFFCLILMIQRKFINIVIVFFICQLKWKRF